MRVVVCGSRDFADHVVVNAVLDGLYREYVQSGKIPSPEVFTIIDGQCPYGGADELAYEWTDRWGWTASERFPPKTNTAPDYHARNRAMIDSGADLCVAFVNKPLSLSRGTASTVHYARSKGVKTIVVEVVLPECRT
jgi:hypothetical protein